MIPINAPQVGDEEIKAVTKVLKSGTLTHGLGAGPMVTRFEKAYAKFMEAKHAIAVNSGTAALHLAVVAAGIKQGDEVILPSFTFVATAEVILAAGAKPVFVDIDPETYNISVEKIEKTITKKTRAIVPVDLYGLPSDMKQIREIADKYELKVVEDAAQAHGASYMGKPPGTFADAACWSFYASKNMTTGEGGMITTNDDELAEKIRFMRSHGEAEKYKSIMLGYNYRMPEIEAAIGYVQLKRLQLFLAKRRENARKLAEKLESAKELQLPKEPKECKHSWYLFTVRLKNAKREERDRVVGELKQKGIGAEVYYSNPIHLMPFYKKFGKTELLETEKAAEQVFSLPVHPGVTMEQLDFIGETVLHLLR
ncbi:MAG: DegT/DnrJ/EryC1/StrS family aminotransferase [Candidatus Bathyarchaeia archaeon]|nr:MAG: aminotransferase DegT [Candidatus Bathyarchaeota archaeon]